MNILNFLLLLNMNKCEDCKFYIKSGYCTNKVLTGSAKINRESINLCGPKATYFEENKLNVNKEELKKIYKDNASIFKRISKKNLRNEYK